MTLGQRIQELRRSRGLSQEGLGDLLGVSRQAISKWESDTTIPEVDKLIAISRHFEISVGTLLGVEEPCAAQEQEPPHELSERELAAVETIVTRYLEQLEQARPQPRERSRWLGWGAGVLVLLLAASGWTVSRINSRIDRLSGQTQKVQNQLIGVENTVSDQINSLTGRLEELLKAQNHLLSQWDCVLSDYIPGEKAVFSLSATPKEYVPGMTADFCVENDAGERVSVPAQWDGKAFAARMDVPLWDDPDFSILLNDGQSRKTQPMETAQIYMLKSDFGLTAPGLGVGTTKCRLTKQNILVLDMVFFVHLEAVTPGGFRRELLYPTQMAVVMSYEGEELLRRELDTTLWVKADGAGQWDTSLSGRYPVPGEGELTAEVVITDNFGTTSRWELPLHEIEYE